MEKEKIADLVSEMTLEEKAGLCSGADFWHTKAIERLGIPAVMFSGRMPAYAASRIPVRVKE